MTIEIREMIIRTKVTDSIGPDQSQDSALSEADMEQIKSDILTECRELFENLLDEREGR
jgi:hypothetical protein